MASALSASLEDSDLAVAVGPAETVETVPMNSSIPGSRRETTSLRSRRSSLKSVWLGHFLLGLLVVLLGIWENQSTR